MVRKDLKKRYFKWLNDVIKELEEKGKAVIMLGDKLIGELRVDRRGYLHWTLLITEETFERLAELEHEQWTEWSKSVAQEVSAKRQRRWEKWWVQYKELSDPVKEWKREWVRKMLKILGAKVLQSA